MPPKGLLNPKNAVQSGPAFKEGYVQVDTSVFKVHRGKSGEGQEELSPVLALAWGVTRLDEENHQPLSNDEGEPLTEELIFSFGGKSLAQLHPGDAGAHTDEDIEDLGVEVGTSGPTVHMINKSWMPNDKSGLNQLTVSMREHGIKEEILDRVWAPDFIGCIFHMTNKLSADKMSRPDLRNPGKFMEFPINYKVVDKVVRGPGQAPKKSAKGGSTSTAQTASSNGKGDMEAILKPHLDKLSEELNGEQVSKKALSAHLMRMLNEAKVDSKLHVQILSLVKDDGWLAKNGGKYDFTFSPEKNNITFGQLAEGARG